MSGGALAAGRELAEASLTGERPDLVSTPVVRVSFLMPIGQKGDMP